MKNVLTGFVIGVVTTCFVVWMWLQEDITRNAESARNVIRIVRSQNYEAVNRYLDSARVDSMFDHELLDFTRRSANRYRARFDSVSAR